MAISNYDRVGKALKLLNSVLAPYAAAEMKRVFPDDALKTAKGYLEGCLQAKAFACGP